MKQLLSVLFLTAGLASAVHLDFGVGVGVKGGFPVTDVLTATGVIGAPPYTTYRSEGRSPPVMPAFSAASVSITI